MTVLPTEADVRTYLAGHMAYVGNAMTSLSKKVSTGWPVTQAVLDQTERCDLVTWRAGIILIDMFDANWVLCARRLNELDEALAAQEKRQEEASDGK